MTTATATILDNGLTALTGQPHRWERQTRRRMRCPICATTASPEQAENFPADCRRTVSADLVAYDDSGLPYILTAPAQPKPAAPAATAPTPVSRPTSDAPGQKIGPPASDRQKAYIRRLVAQSGMVTMRQMPDPDALTKDQASNLIFSLEDDS